MTSEAWRKGYEDFRLGKGLIHNPYDKGTENFSDWVNGWEARMLFEMY